MNLLEVLQLKYPEARNIRDFQVSDNGDGNLYISLWNLEEPIPTEEDIAQWKIDYDLLYRQNLAVSMRVYPPMDEQLNMMYWDKINGTDTWLQMITDIKNQYPKPTE